MKKLLVLILGVVLFACTQQPEGFKINVTLEGAEGQILLEKRGASAWEPIDTADVVEGVAVLEGKVDYPADYYLSVLGQRAKAVVFVENAEMSITGKVDSLNQAKVVGSATHNDWENLNEKLKTFNDEYKNLYTEYQEATAAKDTAKLKGIEEKAMSIRDEMTNTQKEFIKENTGTYIAPFLLGQLQRSMEVEELDEMVSNLDPKLDSVQAIIDLKTKIEQLKKVAIGQIAPDFTQNDTEGNPVKFSEYYAQNELTLLDFWAAWCGPCRGENPNVVAVYNEFKDKGFNVIGVSLDRKKEDWLKAIKEDGLPWKQVSDLGYWQNEASKLYQISSIPSSLLVDKTGKIVAKNKRGDELKKTVAEFLGK